MLRGEKWITAQSANRNERILFALQLKVKKPTMGRFGLSATLCPISHALNRTNTEEFRYHGKPPVSQTQAPHNPAADRNWHRVISSAHRNAENYIGIRHHRPW
jgi:hypothetical protein